GGSVLEQRRIVERPEQTALPRKIGQEATVINVDTQVANGVIQVRSINENRDPAVAPGAVTAARAPAIRKSAHSGPLQRGTPQAPDSGPAFPARDRFPESCPRGTAGGSRVSSFSSLMNYYGAFARI